MKIWRNPDLVSFARYIPELRAGKLTPRELLERCIAAIERREPTVKAFVTLNLAGARKAADASSKRYKAGKPLSALDGCPVGIKDIIATADMPTQMNNPVFKGWQSGQDAACVYALRKGGALIPGKTVTTEFAIGYSGPTTNPFDPARTPGGSSSGSGAAIGAGMLPVALGTQTQASTLRPASFNGAVGFKPSLGALTLAGVHPLSATADHLGIIGATVEDVWLTASQISLRAVSPGYGFIHGVAASLEAIPAPVQPCKLVRLYTRGWTELGTDTVEAFEATVERLRLRGVPVVDKTSDPAVAALEEALEADVDGALSIVAYEMQWPFADYIARFGKQIGERIHGLIDRASKMSPADYVALLETRRRVQQHARTVLAQAGADAFLTLASSGPAILGHEYTGSRAFLVYGSWLGFPGFALPLFDIGGLPCGIQLLGADGTDGALCGAARWIMQEIAGT